MNFFSNWGRPKFSNDNQRSSNLDISKSPDNGNDFNSRTYTPRNVKKHMLNTRSEWYDRDSIKMDIFANLKTAQSVANLDCIGRDEYVSNSSNKNYATLNIGTTPPISSGLKKAFSTDNLLWNRGKSKGAITKDMISAPVNIRVLQPDDQLFPMPKFQESIAESHSYSESNTVALRRLDCIDDNEEETSELDNTDILNVRKSVKVVLRRSQSMGSLLPDKNLKLHRKNICSNRFSAKNFNFEVQVDSISTNDKSSNEILEGSPCVERKSTTSDKVADKNLIQTDDEKTILPNVIENDFVESTDSVDGGVIGILTKPYDDENVDSFKKNANTEVLKSLQSKDDSTPKRYSPAKFPVSDDTEIQDKFNANRLSKSVELHSGVTIRPEICQSFETRKCEQIKLLQRPAKTYKLKKNNFIKYENNNIYMYNENKMERDLLQGNVQLMNGTLVDKKAVQFIDEHKTEYKLTFSSTKDAKNFLEQSKLGLAVTDQKSLVRKAIAWGLGKRSSREVLEKKGIYQNEPIFGNTLRNIYKTEGGVPKFILKTIELIETPDNIKSLGLYRTSGNLAIIQKIRFDVDKGKLAVLDEYWKDVDVLTGCLKLFFRELKEPLISCGICDQLLNVIKTEKTYTKKYIEKIRNILRTLPESNLESLRVLIRHLIEVAKYKDQNKMDTYNLSVCWGPTVIFATEALENFNYKDIVTQSHEATRMFDNLLLFFINNPHELDNINKKMDSLDRNRNLIFRQESVESLQSFDSGNSKGSSKKSGSNLSCADVDEVVRKLVELIELNLKTEGLYKDKGSSDKIAKLSRKLSKKKFGELDKYKADVLELCTCHKRYLEEQEPLVNREAIEQILKYCDNSSCLESNTRHKIMVVLQDLSKKDTFTFLLKHILRVLEDEPFYRVPRSEMIQIWAGVLNHKNVVDHEKFYHFLRIVLEAVDDKKQDILISRGMPNDLLKDLKNHQKERDRTSKYDNVPDDVDYRHESTLSEEQTDRLEHTKL